MFVKRLDVLLLLALVTARVRIDTLADLAAPRPVETIQKVGWLAGLLSPSAWKLLEDWLTDPLSLLLISITFALVLIYVIVDVLGDNANPKAHIPTPSGDPPRAHGGGGRTASNLQPPTSTHPSNHRLKLLLIFAIVTTTVITQSAYLIALRHVAGPATYTHDGGVIQTEETIKFLLQGKNPYTEDYTKTPMADWGLDYKSALYHYPYLPWTFLFSLPFFVVSNATLGWFDERFVYLLLFAGMLLLAARLTLNPTARLVLVMTLGLNPIMGSDIIFGQNDLFVLFWIVLALWLAGKGQGAGGGGQALSLIAFALACASKPTAWFLAPFFFLYATPSNDPPRALGGGGRTVRNTQPRLATRPAHLAGVGERHASRITHYASRITYHALRLAPFAVTFLLIVLPFILWDPYNFYDDVWAWSAGTSATAYQIRGWGLANFVLALNLVSSRLAYFPFWIPELLVCVPLFAVLLRRQWRANTLANVAWHGGILLFAFAFTSRFLNENYLGFIVSLLAIGVLTVRDE